MPVITLPDESTLEFEQPVTLREIAARIGKKLAKAALAGLVDGELKDLPTVVDSDARVAIVTPAMPEGLGLMRHSAAHVMAEAIVELFPGTKLAYGPTVAEGFYYDVDSPEPISADDLPRIEERMRQIVKRDTPFARHELPLSQAIEKYMYDEYKKDNIDRAGSETISFYTQGGFEDMCRGPHVPSTGRIGHFKVMNLAGAYWHGDANKQQLTRVYGTAFATKQELDEHLARIEAAKQRDHRRIGREMELFEFHPEAQGMAFWRPGGVTVYRELENFLRHLGEEHGYEEYRTPQILNKELWITSGHWLNYADKMYITEKDGKEFGVKPMNCPGAMILFKAGLYSHNDLPMRWAEFGHVHRYEGSGEIHGLTRVRGFTQDDAHIFCTPEQLQGQIRHCIELMFQVYMTLGMEFDHIELSTRPEKRIGSDEAWDMAEAALKSALEDLKIEFVMNPGDGAFYGPKIDFHLADAIGRTWQMSTIQVDFAMPEKFDLHYVDEASAKRRPVMIHRAISGSLERFIAVLTEHFAGDFPLWMAPEQVRVCTVTDAAAHYAGQVRKQLREAGIRATLDDRGCKIGAKIREGELKKVPYLAVVGEKEARARLVSVRRRHVGDKGVVDVEAFAADVLEEIRNRALPPKAED